MADGLQRGALPLEIEQFRLNPVGDVDFLENIRTGEWVNLRGRYSMLQAPGGCACLVPRGQEDNDDADVSWARDHMKRRLIWHQEPGREGIAVQFDDKHIEWEADLVRRGRFSKVFEGEVNRFKFKSEVLHSTLPVDDTTCYVWWSLPYIFHYLLGAPSYKSFVSRKATKIRQLFRELDLPQSALRHSFLSVLSKNKDVGEENCFEALEAAEKTFMTSTSGFIAIVASVASHPKQWHVDADTAFNDGVAIVNSVMRRVAHECSCFVINEDSPRVSCCFRKVKDILMVSRFECSSKRLYDWLVKHIFFNNMLLSFGEICIRVYGALKKAYKLSATTKQFLLKTFRRLIDFIEVSVHTSKDADWWNQGSFVRLPDLLGPKQKRRILSYGFKSSVCKPTPGGSKIKAASSIVAAREALKEGNDLVDKVVAQNRSKNASKFTTAHMIGYLDEGRLQNEGSKHAFVQLDGTTLSGMEIEFYCFANVVRKSAHWLPPKAGA